MIESLSIQNYALIDNIELKFQPGLNIITGETGAGKSIMLGALSMLLGGRADGRVVRDREKKSVIEASFRHTENDASLKAIFADADIEWDADAIILRREISPAGRSRAFVNDTPVAISTLREIAMRLVDLHSQHQNLLLATPDYQLAIIDTLLPDKSVIDIYRSAFDEYRDALRQYAKARKAVEAAKAEEEYLRYRLDKLNDANLVDGEQESLEQERDTLSNIGSIAQSLAIVDNILASGDNSILNQLPVASAAARSVLSLSECESIAQRLEAISVEVKDIAETVESLADSLRPDPSRLEYIDDRLSDIYSLQRKHNLSTVGELIALRDSIASRISAIDTADERLHTLAIKAKRAKALATEHAQRLTQARCEVAQHFAKLLCDSAIPLGMKNLRVEIAVEPADLSPTGADVVNFKFAFNKNQPLMPVKDTASGGEISRLMLSVKAILADKMNLPSIIFDEIDTGVSGDVADRMGRLMQQIAGAIQVIAITHLPQIAAKGTSHFKVYKEDTDTSTHTRVVTLSEEARVDELALMLSGDPHNEAARMTAKSLITKS